MTSDEAGRQKGQEKNTFRDPCLHQRMVEYHYDEHHKRTGHLLCKECGDVIPDPFKNL